MIKLYIEVKLFRENMGRDGDGECKDFAKGVCFRGARFQIVCPLLYQYPILSFTNILSFPIQISSYLVFILLIPAASIGMSVINKILTLSHSAKTSRAIGIFSSAIN